MTDRIFSTVRSDTDEAIVVIGLACIIYEDFCCNRQSAALSNAQLSHRRHYRLLPYSDEWFEPEMGNG